MTSVSKASSYTDISLSNAVGDVARPEQNRPGLSIVNAQTHSVRVLSLAKELERIQSHLGALVHSVKEQPGIEDIEVRPFGRGSGAANAMRRASAIRSQYFPRSLFADPAWDMLLFLYAAEMEQHRVSVTQLSIASGVPSSTAHRWIQTLEATRLVERRPDPLDQRRQFLSLSPAAVASMERYLRAINQD